MKPYLFDIFGFKVPSYGVMIFVAYMLSYFYLLKKSKDYALDKKILTDIIFYSVISGFAGGKIFYIITFWEQFGNSFFDRLLSIFSFENIRSGFVFYGGLIGGIIGFIVIVKKNNLDFFKTADLFSPAMALAHAVSRIGCFLAGCCHGRETDFFAGVVFSSPYCYVSPELIGHKIHPSQLYESFGNFVIFLFLNFQLSKNKIKGKIFLMYLLMYSVMRFIIEFTRGDERGEYILGLSQAQFISVLVLIVVIVSWKKILKIQK